MTPQNTLLKHLVSFSLSFKCEFWLLVRMLQTKWCSHVGHLIERIQVICNNQQDLQDWLDHLHHLTKRTSARNSSIKSQNVPCHTVSYHDVRLKCMRVIQRLLLTWSSPSLAAVPPCHSVQTLRESWCKWISSLPHSSSPVFIRDPSRCYDVGAIRTPQNPEALESELSQTRTTPETLSCFVLQRGIPFCVVWINLDMKS